MRTITERPADSAGAISTDPAILQREREMTLHDLARLRKQARDEIDRLIAFLDASDPYVMTELEADPAESGIADNDGLQEQIGRRDWLRGVFG